jgi:hypothetical protein
MYASELNNSLEARKKDLRSSGTFFLKARGEDC